MKTAIGRNCLAALLAAVAVTAASRAQDLSTLEVRRIPIEKRWGRPVPTRVPEIPVVLRENIFLGNEPNHPTIGPEEKPYHPIRAGGFWKQNGTRYFNRPLFYKGSMVGTGDRPMFLIARGYGKQWAAKLRFAFSRSGRSKWLDEFESIRTEFWPGEVRYLCEDPSMGLTVKLTAAAGMVGWSSVFALEVDGRGAADAQAYWIFGDAVSDRDQKAQMWWIPKPKLGDAPGNSASEVSEAVYRLVIDANHEQWKGKIGGLQLRTLEFYAGSRWPDQRIVLVNASDVQGAPQDLHPSAGGQLIACRAPLRAGWRGTVAVAWGGEPNEPSLARLEADMRRLKLSWGEALYREWRENFVDRGTRPKESLERLLGAPDKALEDSRKFWEDIRQRIVFDFPDDELSAWANWLAASQEYLHWPLGQIDGLDVWGQAYLHIHNMYSGWDYLGVHDQQQEWLRLYATSVRNGWIGLYHGIAPWSGGPEIAHVGEEDQIPHYANYIYTHWLWTGDDRFVRDVWPFLKQLLDRELMQNDPDGDGLFAARMPYWAPEDDSFGPKTGLQSSQMLRALRGAAELARVADDSEAGRRYGDYAAKIARALPQLWDSASGRLGWRDPLNVLHISPSAHDVFFPILRGAVDEFQGYQMLRWVRENLWSEVYPGIARVWLTANSGPKQGLGPLPDISWSTVSAAGLVGDIDHFYPVLKTFAHSYFYNSWPGAECSGVSAWGSGSAGMNDHNDGRMPALYLLGRGLFGLEPDLPHNRLTIEPRFPSQWKTASIRTSDLTYRFDKSNDEVRLHVSTPRALAKTLRIPVSQQVVGVTVDGNKASYHVEPSINRAFVVVELPSGRTNTVAVATAGPALRLTYNSKQTLDVPFRVTADGAEGMELLDPQKALRTTSIAENTLEAVPIRTGDRTAFLKVSRHGTSLHLPLDLTIVEPFAIVHPRLDPGSRTLSFEIENRSRGTGKSAARVKFRGTVQSLEVSPGRNPVSLSLNDAVVQSICPGRNPIEVEVDGRTYRHEFVDWTLPPPTQPLLLDLAWDYHEEAASLFNTKFYYDAWQMGIDYPVLPPATYEWAGLRIDNPKLTSTRFLATGNIPFYLASEKKLGGVYQAAEGGGPRNVLPVANWRPGLYPGSLVIPVEGMKLSKAYFLAYSWQRGRKTFHPNVELIANYMDGGKDIRQLIPPYSFMPQHQLVSVNRHPYLPEVVDSGLSIGKEKAEIYDLPLDPTRVVRSIEVRSVTTESIFAIFGITLARAE